MKEKTGGADNERIFKLLVSIDVRITNIEERMSDLVTKDNLDYMRNKIEERISEVQLELRGLGRAIDKDALSIINYEKRIARLEKQLAVK